MVAALNFWSCDADAFWGSKSKDNTSGLNVAAGFDVNTITTLYGTVFTQPVRTGQEQHTEMTISTVKSTATVILGPWWYWEKQTVIFAKNQEVTVTGSLAQGKDGVLYIFAQRIENQSSGETVTLRSESGKPLWAHSGSGNQSGIRQHDGSGPRSGTGNRGSGPRGGRR